jgi:hypothetical protein
VLVVLVLISIGVWLLWPLVLLAVASRPIHTTNGREEYVEAIARRERDVQEWQQNLSSGLYSYGFHCPRCRSTWIQRPGSEPEPQGQGWSTLSASEIFFRELGRKHRADDKKARTGP